MDKKSILKSLFLYVVIFIVSFAFINANFFNSYFVFVVPFIFFCFLNGKRYGVMAFVSSFFIMFFYNFWFSLLLFLIVVSFAFFRSILKISGNKMINILGGCNFFIVFICDLVEKLLSNSVNYFLSFIIGVISYWLMVYFGKLYFAFKGEDERKLDSPLVSFVLISLGIIAMGVDLRLWVVDFSFALILFLAFVSCKIGLEIGCSYTLFMVLALFLRNGYNIDLVVLGYTFLLVFFMRKVSKFTLFLTYIGSAFFVVYYFNEEYLRIINYFLGAIMFLLLPSVLLKRVCEICYSSELYVKKLCEDNKKFNLEIANKIIKMEEVFSLVCEKIDIRDRIRKSDKKLFIEEVNMFENLLKCFSSDIKENYDFNINYKVEREFYGCGIDLLNFRIKENIFKRKIVELDVRCEKNEINNYILPLVSRVLGFRCVVDKILYNDVFGYYTLFLEDKNRVSFNYGISQRSVDKKICGDSYLVYENDSKYIFAISDGMGNGSRAKESSKLLLDLFRKFMDIGFDLDQTIKSINSILRNKYDKESYSTLDLFVYDKMCGKFYFCKNGAGDSYLFGDVEKIIQGNKLPLGIVENLQFEFREVEFNKGDVLIMASDGVSEESFKDVNSIKHKNSQKISEIVISKDNKINDDKTVFVIKIC